jgi:hypothetical protein
MKTPLSPDYTIEITEVASVIALWAFTKNHRLTYGLSSNFLQTPITQALDAFLAILLYNPGLLTIMQKVYLYGIDVAYILA